ncbi:alkaline ceramidase, partial [uncultured Ruthenibacterium sp.]|uniref:alkaline ceramidase n=1 Tax=uncultured Ruthenibacterium sp. TaxID=1905347 RepID=UPI00349EEE89
DIFVRVHDYRCGDQRAVMIYGDLLWWNREFISMARPRLAAMLEVKEQQILFVASHNHSGPGTGNSFTPLLETADPEYIDFLYAQIESAVLEACENGESVIGTVHRGQCALNVYRRVHTPQGIGMCPNYEVDADHHLTVVKWSRKDGSVKGLLVHYPCHANLSNGNEIHPDYPGVALRTLDQMYPGSVGLFLQGCTADLRPNSVIGGQFVPQSYAGVQNFAQQFVNQCEALLKAAGENMQDGVSVYQYTENLPLEQENLLEKIEQAREGDEIHRQWASAVVSNHCRNTELLEISNLRLGSLSIFLFNAEMAQKYAAIAREAVSGALSVGYCNGMIGYLSTEHQICHGGYEPQGSALYFALAGTYSTQIESLIANGIYTLAKQH